MNMNMVLGLTVLSALITMTTTSRGGESLTNSKTEEGKPTIEWLGHASFLITASSGVRIITDPYDRPIGYRLPLPEADIVLVSHDHFDHNATGNVPGNPHIIRGEGPKKEAGLNFLGIASFHDEVQGAKRGRNVIFTWEMEGIRFAHLGDLGHLLTDKQLSQMKDVNVLFIPVGGIFTIDYRAAPRIVDQVNPRLVVPMHYKTEKIGSSLDGVEKFLQGKENVKRLKSNRFQLTPDLLSGERKIIVPRFRE